MPQLRRAASTRWRTSTRSSDEIGVIPLRFVIKRHKRKKYACRCGSCIETALGPDKLCPGGRYSVDFAIYVAITKYCDHLPLERQVRMMAREGLVVTSQTLWDQIEQLAWLVESAMPRLRAHVLGHPVVGADETSGSCSARSPARVRAGTSGCCVSRRPSTTPSARAAASRRQRHCSSLVRRHADVRRLRRIPLALGRVPEAWCSPTAGLTSAGSSSRSRSPSPGSVGRSSTSSASCTPSSTKCRVPRATTPKRHATQKSRPVIDQIVEWFYRTLPKCLPESGLHKAIGYMVHMWPGLVLFLDDPASRSTTTGRSAARAAR